MKVCISCQTDVTGKRAVPVKEDRIIRIIRAIKKLFNVAQMNQLYLCDACLPKHAERRKSFEKTMLFASVLAGVMMVIIIIAPLLSGRFDLWSIPSGIIVGLLLLALPIFKYVPAVESATLSVPVKPEHPKQKQQSSSMSLPKSSISSSQISTSQSPSPSLSVSPLPSSALSPSSSSRVKKKVKKV